MSHKSTLPQRTKEDIKRKLTLTFNLFPYISQRKRVLEIHSCWHLLTGWQLWRNHTHTLLLSFTFGLTKTELSPQPIWHKICLFYQWIRDKPQTNLTVNFMLTLHLDKRIVSWFKKKKRIIHLLTAQLSFWFPASLSWLPHKAIKSLWSDSLASSSLNKLLCAKTSQC